MPDSAPISTQTRVLLAVHSPGLANTMLKALGGMPLHIVPFTAGSAATLANKVAQRVAEVDPGLVILEIEGDALTLAHLRFHNKQVPVVALLSDMRPEAAFYAGKFNAEDVIAMSSSPEIVQKQIADVLSRLPHNIPAPPPAPPAASPSAEENSSAISGNALPELFGSHPRMAEIRDTIAKVATTSATVLIRGESGVGKEVVARMIYNRSQRSARPFVKVNCAAIPNELLESELFGYEPGAFTGAVRAKPGKFELAHTGTLFLDEIGEMHPQLQAKLLHVLQDGVFARLGAKKDVQVDVRLLCATNKLLEQRVAEGLFREDLFYRINVVTVHIPPLRERRDEIPVLTEFFLEKYAALYGSEPAHFSKAALDDMLHYNWPGNIRELENLCKRFVIVGGETQILREMATRKPETAHAAPPVLAPALPLAAPAAGPSLLEVGKKASHAAEREVIRQMLVETRWNRREAARRLQISYKALLNKIRAMQVG